MDTLRQDLIAFAARIAGRLIHIDGPYRDRRGICYRCGTRWFRNYEAALRYRDRHNAQIWRNAYRSCRTSKNPGTQGELRHGRV